MRNISTQLSWLLLGLGSAVVVGISAAAVQIAGLAPVGIVAIVAGAALGALLVAALRSSGLPCSNLVMGICVLFALVTVTTEHLWHYRHYQQQWQRVRDENPALEMFRDEDRPKSLPAYLQTEASPGRLVYWVVDAALLTTSAVTVLLVAGRQALPYWGQDRPSTRQ